MSIFRNLYNMVFKEKAIVEIEKESKYLDLFDYNYTKFKILDNVRVKKDADVPLRCELPLP
jgi:hypothetical protein